MAMIALKPFKYGGRTYKSGDRVEPRSQRDANLLRKAKWAGDKAEAAKVEDAIDQIETADDESQKPKKGRYVRRDLRAEG